MDDEEIRDAALRLQFAIDRASLEVLFALRYGTRSNLDCALDALRRAADEADRRMNDAHVTVAA